AGWRWVFLINLPLAAIVIVTALRHVPETWDTAAAGRFDVLGAVLAALGLAGVTYGLVGAGQGAVPATVLVVGLILLGWFALLEIRRSRVGQRVGALVPVEVFGSRVFTSVNVVTLIMYAAMGVVFFLLIVQLQVSAGFSPIAAGSAMLPVTLLMLVLSAPAGQLAKRIGPRPPMTVGILLAGAGFVVLSGIGPGSSYLVDVLPGVVLFGLGISAAVAPLTATVLAAASERHAGVASGVNNAVARTGSLLAVAAIPPLVGLTGAAFESARVFTEGFHTAMLTCAAMMGLAALITVVTITDDVFREPRRHTHCTVDAPPLDQVGSDLPGHTAESVHRGDVPHGGLGSPAPE
ncbi:MAG TPA: MFS transporter, partial [Thermopolyspora sp.]